MKTIQKTNGTEWCEVVRVYSVSQGGLGRLLGECFSRNLKEWRSKSCRAMEEEHVGRRKSKYKKALRKGWVWQDHQGWRWGSKGENVREPRGGQGPHLAGLTDHNVGSSYWVWRKAIENLCFYRISVTEGAREEVVVRWLLHSPGKRWWIPGLGQQHR